MSLPEIRNLIFKEYYDNCFCDDVGQYPLCKACVRVKEILSLIDAEIAIEERLKAFEDSIKTYKPLEF